MGSITVLDLFLMLVGSIGKGQHTSVDVLRSLYERAHSRDLIIFGALLALVASIAGTLTSLLSQQEAPSVFAAVVLMSALVVALISLVVLGFRLRRLQREYLDIMQVYNLMARFF